jgi:hypothetical protein
VLHHTFIIIVINDGDLSLCEWNFSAHSISSKFVMPMWGLV